MICQVGLKSRRRYEIRLGIIFIKWRNKMIKNPILPGFNPDPSILRVGEDYYIATSTFEWTPAIAIYHSRDLKHWQLINHALKTKEQLTLAGVGSSLGVWAPALSHNEKSKKFYLCYSVIHGANNNNFDLDNYVVTTNDIGGNWSLPIYLNSSGFDPSLFHDDDGRSWLCNLEWDSRQGYQHPGCIVLEEYDTNTDMLLGSPVPISRGGTNRGCLEGPFIYKRNGYYYLITAEGGTGYGHCVAVSRATNIKGPYECKDNKATITSQPEEFNERGIEESMKLHRYNPGSYLQRSGHGFIVETSSNEFYMTHLCSRPIMPLQRSILGRETAIQKCRFTDDNWVELDSDDNLAKEYVEEPKLKPYKFPKTKTRDNFLKEELSPDYYTLREHFNKSWLKVGAGVLSLRGRDSLFSTYNQSIIAKKITDFNVRAEAELHFSPENFMQMAGLTCYYNNNNFYYLRLYYSQSLESKCLGILIADNGNKKELLEYRVPVKENQKAIQLCAEILAEDLQFYYALKDNCWQKIGPVLDATILSDEYANGFTGTFIGLTAQDLYKKSKWADFTYFELK